MAPPAVPRNGAAPPSPDHAARRCARRKSAAAESTADARTGVREVMVNRAPVRRTDTGVGTMGRVDATSCADSVDDKAQHSRRAIVFMAFGLWVVDGAAVSSSGIGLADKTFPVG